MTDKRTPEEINRICAEIMGNEMQRLTLQDLEKLAKRFESDPWTEKAAAAPLLLENLREALKLIDALKENGEIKASLIAERDAALG